MLASNHHWLVVVLLTTGGVYKRQGRIHYKLMTYNYKAFLIHAE